ncbi:MAG: hypothetical protein OXN84_21270 [Albidovulum sp.]|nr:hypothetical protein [Albidovulum sp.]MDE0531179.1 hypothetical protein [Albidovulum sp.]
MSTNMTIEGDKIIIEGLPSQQIATIKKLKPFAANPIVVIIAIILALWPDEAE